MEATELYVIDDYEGTTQGIVTTEALARAIVDARRERDEDWGWDGIAVYETREAAIEGGLFPEPEEEEDGPDIARPAGDVAEAVPFGECTRCQATTVRQVEGEYLCVGCQEAEGMAMDDPAQQPELGEDPPEPPLEERAW